MPGYLCECDSWKCKLMAFVSDKDFEKHPTLFQQPDAQFIVAGCECGPDEGATLLYENSRFQVYQDKE